MSIETHPQRNEQSSPNAQDKRRKALKYIGLLAGSVGFTFGILDSFRQKVVDKYEPKLPEPNPELYDNIRNELLNFNLEFQNFLKAQESLQNAINGISKNTPLVEIRNLHKTCSYLSRALENFRLKILNKTREYRFNHYLHKKQKDYVRIWELEIINNINAMIIQSLTTENILNNFLIQNLEQVA